MGDLNGRVQTDLETLRSVTAAAADVFASSVRRRAAVAYLEGRGIGAGDLPPAWHIGFAPPGWTRLTDSLRLEFDDQALIDAGVARRSTRGTLFDTFRDRVVFGVRDPVGTIAGFVGRDLSNHPRAPKYLNSPQQPLFDKGALLYGFAEGRTDPATRQMVVVEGPLDVLAIATRTRRDRTELWPVAPCGTALTSRQAQLVAAAASEPRSPVTIAMDGDPAGRRAGVAAGEVLHMLGADVRIATLPAGSDPAEFLATPRATTALFRADQAVPLLVAQVESAVSVQGDRMQSPEGRVAALRGLAQRITEYPPHYVARQIPWLSERLGLHHSTVTLELADAFARPGRAHNTSRDGTSCARPLVPR